MHALLIPFGSAGDVNPFLGLAAELQRRGHTVTVATNGYFVPKARASVSKLSNWELARNT